jgi:DNA-binding transcriptional regulator YiaG
MQPMPNLGSVLKSEITRLARKEIKALVDPLRKANATYRREIAELKRQVASLQRELRTVAKPLREKLDTKRKSRNVRFVPKGVKSLRVRLGLSAADFGRLIGASGQSIYNWEAGKAVPRTNQLAALAAVRGLGKREAEKRLDALA